MATNIVRSAPQKVRARIYSIYAVLGIVIGATQVGYAAAEAGQPVWLTVTLAVFAFVGGAIGYTATTHTGDSPVVGGPEH